MGKLALLAVAVACLSVVSCSTLSSTLTLIDQRRIANVLKGETKDLASVYYAVTGLTAIGKDVPDKEAKCSFAAEKLNKNSALSLMQYSFIVKLLGCQDVPDLSISSLVTDGIEPINLANLITAMANLGQQVDEATIKKFATLAKDNDAPNSAAASFLAASVLPASPELKPVVSMVEDIVAQADEVNNDYLQFEGGLAVTSKVVSGIIALGEQQGQKLIKDEQAIKFAKYFLNRKYVHSLKDIHHLLVGLGALSNNKQLVPVVVSVFRSALITKENPALKVRVTNLLDQTIPDITVTAISLETAQQDSTTILENKDLVKSDDADDFIVIDSEVAKGFIAAHSYKIDVMEANPTRGAYSCKLEVGLSKDSKHLVLDGPFTVSLKVLARIMVEDVEIGVGDRDHSTVSKINKLKFPAKLSAGLDADFHQKVVMTFNLKDMNTDQLVTAHQTFIRLVHETTGQEIFFVAEADSDDHYKFTLDVGATGKDSFNHQSGKYRMSLIVGDKAMQLPISWTLGDVTLTFSGQPKTTKRQERITEPKPVIEHMFRVPEKRPAKIVSSAFTILVVSPLLIMFGMWGKIGANISNLSLTIPTLLFHVGLACIFSLYYMFWVSFDMFYTLKLLVLIGGMTFLGGNKMLADMAALKYKS